MNLFRRGMRALVLGAHTDDEFGCAGTIARMVEAGVEVHYACFSPCEESVPAGWDRDVLRHEVRDAIGILGIDESHFRLYDYRVRHFPSMRQEILEDMVVLRREVEPELVFAPAFSDMHQDHGVVAQEAFRAFKHASVLGYELPMNTISFQHACFIQLEPEHVDTKVRHALAYRSQGHRAYLREEFIRSLATVRGLQINRAAAEAFEVVRLAIL